MNFFAEIIPLLKNGDKARSDDNGKSIGQFVYSILSQNIQVTSRYFGKFSNHGRMSAFSGLERMAICGTDAGKSFYKNAICYRDLICIAANRATGV